MPIFKLVPRESRGTDREKARLLRPYRQFIARLKRAKNKLGQVALKRGERLSRVRALLREAAQRLGVSARLSRDGKALTVTLQLRPRRKRRRRRSGKVPAVSGRKASVRRRARRRGARPATAARQSSAKRSARKGSRPLPPKETIQAP